MNARGAAIAWGVVLATAPFASADQGHARALPPPGAQSVGAAQAGLRTQRAEPGASAPLARDEEAARAALQRALAFLAAESRRGDDGSLPTADARFAAPVAVTALAALAWMSAGNTPARGPQGTELATAIDWLVAHTDLADPRLATGYVSSSSDLVSRMHGHGFATLALAQAWCMSPASARGARLSAALEASVRCIERGQGIEGGWWYQPQKGLNHEGSITIAAVQALRAAREAGLRVEPLVIARAIDYVARSQKEDGSFRYALGDEHTSVALTAAAISTLNAAGKYDGAPLKNGYDFLVRELAAREQAGVWGADASDPKDGQHVSCPYYERLYLAQAFWQALDRSLFETWYGRERLRVLGSQEPDGGWKDERYGRCYATAMNALFLALPDGLLPMFQR